ncbi:MAG: transposase [Candidatus Nitrosocosmicus sp.]
MIGCIPWPIAPRKRGRPYVYSPTVILRCFIVRIWFRIDSNNALHTFLKLDCYYNRKLAVACGLVTIPHRRTFDRRLKTMSTDIKERISPMGYLFVIEGLVDSSITAIDSTLLKAKGSVWHKSSMKKGIVPCPGIDTDARWGYSHTKGWIFGYKLHLTCTTAIDELVVPLTADVTTANVSDNRMYIPLTSSSSVFSLPYLLYMIADPGYDDKKLYEYSKKTLGIDLICPVERYKSTFKKRLELVCFYESVLGQQAIYSRRRISIEPLIEHIKSIFRIDPLPAREFHTVSAIVLLSVLLYQLMVYYNCKTKNTNPKSIKYMLGTG